MTRFCAACGTEVDDTAVFCPTCGQPIDQEVESQMPAAPAWPDPEPPSDPERAAPSFVREQPLAPALDADDVAPPPAAPRPDNFDDEAAAAHRAADLPREDVTRVEGRVPSPEPPVPAPQAPAGASPDRPQRRPARTSVPVTMPVTLSAWLIGGGSAVAAVGALVSLFDGFGSAIDLLALVALAAVAVSVFLSASIPAIPHQRFATLAVVLVAFGIGLDRLGFGGSGIGTLLLFLGAAAAAIGAVLLELGRDQPLGGPQT